ncbi:MAG: efflux RND transporter permease subunit [bacterium]
MQKWKKSVDHNMERWGYLVVRYRWLVIALSLLVVGGFASQMRHLYFDASNEAFFKGDDPILVNYNSFRDQFGRDDLILVGIDTPEVFNAEFLRKLQAMQDDLEREVPHIREVNSLLTVRSTRGAEDELIVGDLIEEIPEDSQRLAALKEYVLSSPTYPNWVISPDGQLTTITLELNPYVLPESGEEDLLGGFDDTAMDADLMGGFDEAAATDGTDMQAVTSVEENEAIIATKAVMERYEGENFRTFISGGPVYGSSIQDSMQSNLPKFSGISIGLMFLLLLVLFRRISGVLLPILLVVLSMVVTLGFMGAFGRPFTVINQILPSFILAIGVADAVHVLTIFYRHRMVGNSKGDSVAYALSHSGLAIVMTSFTTAGGLWSFANAASAPIADLGIYGGLGVLAAMALTLTLLPAILAVLPGGPQPLFGRKDLDQAEHTPSLADHVLSSCGKLAVNHPKQVMIGCGVVVMIALVGIAQLRPSNWPLRWFPENAEFRQHTQIIDSRMGGSSNIEVLLNTGKSGGLYEPDFMNRLDQLNTVATEELKFPKGEVVGKAQSVLDVLKESNRALNENRAEFYAVPQARDLIAQEMFLFSNSGSDDLEKLTDVGFSMARLSLYIPNLDAIDSIVFTGQLEEKIQSIFGNTIEYSITGIAQLWAGTMTNVLNSMRNSYIIALILITGLMVVFLGSWKVGLLSMIPNLTPILITLGLMGFFDLPLDPFTILIGSIGIGLVVDDTVHFLSVFQRYFDRYGNAARAIQETMMTTGKALLFTTLILVGGFASYMAADFVNIFAFGMLLVVCIGSALILDVLAAPALMMLVYGKQSSGEQPRAYQKESDFAALN